MNINLGAPYERIIKRMIEKGYAGSQTEVIRQALMALDREIHEEEVILVNRGIEAEMGQIRSGKLKTVPHEQVKKKYSSG
jgi:Arc/MetJ-type ribon-helix-helix transcriptional regulator